MNKKIIIYEAILCHREWITFCKIFFIFPASHNKINKENLLYIIKACLDLRSSKNNIHNK